MFRLLFDRKGVSPIISALLLIVITVAAFGSLYAVTLNWIGNQRNTTVKTMREDVIFEDVWFRTLNGSRSLVSIYLWNAGDVDVTINSDVLVGGDPYTTEPLPLQLLPRQGGCLNVTVEWIPNRTYKITVLTLRGGVFTVYAFPN